ncbi:hypothetical protein Q2941_12300 [Bradyrhizobium sp. UFLA05-153]
MPDWAQSLLQAISNTRWLRWIGLRQLASWFLARHGRAMIGFGANFFASRTALEQHRSFDDLIGSTEAVDAIYITGRSFIRNDSKRFRRIRRLILPDPRSDSFRFYEQSTGEPNLVDSVLRATAVCRDDIKIEVRWCEVLVQQSVLIGDSDKSTGWVHAELAVPFSKANSRPSFTVTKRRFENVVNSYQETFNQLWAVSYTPDASPEPPRKPLRILPKPPPKIAARLESRLLEENWMLTFDPTRGRGKPLVFLDGGSFGEGGNHNETRWELKGDILQIYRETGVLQNRFRYDRTGDRFIWIKDPSAKGIDHQVIYNVR